MEFMGYDYGLSLIQNVINLAKGFKSESLDQNLTYAVEYLVKVQKCSDRDIFEAARALMEELSIDEALLRDARNAQHTKTVGRMLRDYL